MKNCSNRNLYRLNDSESFRGIIEGKGLTYRQLAKDEVMTCNGLTSLSRGGNTPKAKAQGIANYLHMDFDELFTETEIKPLSQSTVKKPT